MSIFQISATNQDLGTESKRKYYVENHEDLMNTLRSKLSIRYSKSRVKMSLMKANGTSGKSSRKHTDDSGTKELLLGKFQATLTDLGDNAMLRTSQHRRKEDFKSLLQEPDLLRLKPN